MSDDDIILFISSPLETSDTNISINKDTTGCSPSLTHGEAENALEWTKH